MLFSEILNLNAIAVGDIWRSDFAFITIIHTNSFRREDELLINSTKEVLLFETARETSPGVKVCPQTDKLNRAALNFIQFIKTEI
mmetsp:Transcript_6565/g.13749  ORF Transcript_6565/g.13749 Transcript_6565/m.13749 type:complete len:85 (+) Transcript_6565:152-406(+)